MSQNVVFLSFNVLYSLKVQQKNSEIDKHVSSMNRYAMQRFVLGH